jgi:PBP1b-binding outer membrane lipoprotein LpoB
VRKIKFIYSIALIFVLTSCSGMQPNTTKSMDKVDTKVDTSKPRYEGRYAKNEYP